MDLKTIEKIGRELYIAEQSRVPIPTMSKDYRDFTVDDAYRIQKCVVEHHLNAGNTLSGKKIGLTSKAMRELVNIDEPDYGVIFNQSYVQNEGEIKTDDYIIPRVEAELVFKLKADLDMKGVTEQDVAAATEYVTAAFEIIDNRYDIEGQTVEDSISDNAAFGAYVLGDKTLPVEEIDLRQLGFVLEKNGRQICTGSGAAVMGNPLKAMMWLSNRMYELGSPLRAGDLILSGSMIAAVSAEKGDYFRGQFGQLGDVCVHFI